MTTAQATAETFSHVIHEVRSHQGATLEELSFQSPVLVVFLRHAGCTFCREALADLQQQRAKIEATGCRIALVHLGDEAAAAPFFAGYNLADVPRFADPEKRLYRVFELQRGSISQLLGPAVWLRGAKAFFAGHGLGMLQGDGFQMPGAFVISKGQIIQAFRHQLASDRPDYTAMSESCRI